jgi:hypothetical protein
MIFQTVFAASLIVQSVVIQPTILNVSLDSRTPAVSDPGTIPQISVHQREVVLLPLVRQATECIVRRVKADRRYSDSVRPGEINDLIVDAMPACEGLLRAVIDAHDRMYGSGSGDAFLMGPYLDVLPSAIARQVKLKPAAR